jgi:hypothetical protein
MPAKSCGPISAAAWARRHTAASRTLMVEALSFLASNCSRYRRARPRYCRKITFSHTVIGTETIQFGEADLGAMGTPKVLSGILTSRCPSWLFAYARRSKALLELDDVSNGTEPDIGQAIVDRALTARYRLANTIKHPDIISARVIEKSSIVAYEGEPSLRFNHLQDNRPAIVPILCRLLHAVRLNLLTLLRKRAEHGFEIWN